MIAAHMIGFAEAQKKRGATYTEWWSWYSGKAEVKTDRERLPYEHDRCRVVWKDLHRTGVLVASDIKRNDSQVYTLRKGASVLDYTRGAKRVQAARRVSLSDDDAGRCF